MQQLITRIDENLGVGVFDSVAWALSEHVKVPDTLEYNAAILYGSEDCPSKIEFYTQAGPLVTDTVAFTWVRDEIA